MERFNGHEILCIWQAMQQLALQAGPLAIYHA